MTATGWGFMLSFWIILIAALIWSYKVLLTEKHIPVGPLEDDYHPESCDIDERPARFNTRPDENNPADSGN